MRVIAYVGTMAKPGPKVRTQLGDVVEAFTGRDDRGEPLTAPELADVLDCSRRTALDKLHALGDQGRLRSKKVGGRSRVWWEPITDSDTTQATLSYGTDGASDERATDDVDGEGDLGTALANLELDEDRREALKAMYAYLKEHGSAQKSDFVEYVYPEHPAGYASSGGWWNRLGKDTLGSLPGVEKPSEGRPIWYFTPV